MLAGASFRMGGWRGLTSLAVLVFAVFLSYYGSKHASFEKTWLLSLSSLTTNSHAQESSYKVFAITPNSGGLRLDAAIYKRYLGAEMSLLEKPPPPPPPPSKSSIDSECFYLFLEVTPNYPTAVLHDDWKKGDTKKYPCRVMLMVNTDQFRSENLEMPHLELLLCKTRQCVSWAQQVQAEHLDQNPKSSRIPILYTGFTSFAPPIPLELDNSRFGRFLHVAGSSPHKGSWNILQAWLMNPTWPTLTITSYDNKLMDTVFDTVIKQQLGMTKLPDNIHHMTTKLSREEISELMHSHGVHLCLSGMEGFGHYMNEARAVGALVVAVDYPSMNEMVTPETGLLAQPSNMLKWTNGLPYANIDPSSIVSLMNTVVLTMSLVERAELGRRAQAAFRQDQHSFDRRMGLFQCYLLMRRRAKGSEEGIPGCAKECGLTLE